MLSHKLRAAPKALLPREHPDVVFLGCNSYPQRIACFVGLQSADLAYAQALRYPLAADGDPRSRSAAHAGLWESLVAKRSRLTLVCDPGTRLPPDLGGMVRRALQDTPDHWDILLLEHQPHSASWRSPLPLHATVERATHITRMRLYLVSAAGAARARSLHRATAPASLEAWATACAAAGCLEVFAPRSLRAAVALPRRSHRRRPQLAWMPPIDEVPPKAPGIIAALLGHPYRKVRRLEPLVPS